ncbi:hypothetical protein BT96DRAFT_945213 [Gymnopus androsaceus JB14]|uniref:Uncharacterized protein n=1 Tax=Gymnopus androsaceus JB14 TaxID=1447944 RepID=A0A6A4H1T7_9AGAR|nr:hypothetical protein BT96DRAFT_945213 [Gymnopus androsaceus JB14]
MYFAILLQPLVHGTLVRGKELLTCQQDDTLQPSSKLYLVSSLLDYLVHCLADGMYLQQSVNATNEALHAIHSSKEQIGIQNVFEASFIKDFKGPDGKLFMEREDKFVQAWQPGLRVTRTAASESGAMVEAEILHSVNNLPTAHKVAGFAGTGSAHICSICQLTGKAGLFNTNHAQWMHRDSGKLHYWATTYRDSQTLDEQKDIFNKYSVHWSSLWLLEYWDPMRMLVIESMHCIMDSIQPHYYPDHIEVDPKHIPDISKIQDTLCYAIEGDKSLSLDGMWICLDRQVSSALQFVVWSLDLSPTLDNISPIILSLYVECAKCKSKQKNHDNIQFPPRLAQPHNSSEFVVKTGAPETLLYILKVIKETVTPSWLNSVPKDFGNTKAGTLKANEWQMLSTVNLPIVLIILWGNADSSAPPEDNSDAGFLLKALDHTMALFQATTLACQHSMTVSHAFAY